jgi:allophanate hydrolase
MSSTTLPVTIAQWRAAYQAGAQPASLLASLLDRLDPQDPAWICLASPQQLDEQLQALAERRTAAGDDPQALPLYGVPFAVKDNIDVAGWPTTAACPAFATLATQDASVVQRLRAAGAVLLGKTNLDQFATGLVGTRSPYGAVPNTLDPSRVSGGSSSGSASVVARGLLPFALGTDTAGSGRIPAGFNQLVGLKPTPGSVPMNGVLPACRTLDVVSVFALDLADAAEVMAVMAVMEGPDEGPVFQRHAPRLPWLGRLGRPLRIGVPAATAELDGALGYPQAWQAALQRLTGLTPQDDAAAPPAWAGEGLEIVPVDLGTFFAVAALLYDGPWVAERHSVVRRLLAEQPEALDPTVHQVIAQALDHDATSTFEAQYRLKDLEQATLATWADVDVLMLPTAPTHPTLAEVAAEPLRANSALGRYTNFVNLLGLAALALPAEATPSGLPFGVTFVAPGGSDAALAALGSRWERCAAPLPRGAGLALPPVAVPKRWPAAAPTLALAVVGAHLSGMPLHGQLVERGARLLARTRSAARYRLHALPGTVPPKPGLARVADDEVGHAIELEVYELPLDQIGSFLALIPPPLGLGSVELAEEVPTPAGPSRWVKGFICEGAALATAPDISAHGGWRAYMAARARGEAA